jgi:pathogenesis-related protein 1
VIIPNPEIEAEKTHWKVSNLIQGMKSVLFISFSLIIALADPQVDHIAEIQKKGLCYKANQPKKEVPQPVPQPADPAPQPQQPSVSNAPGGFAQECLNAHNAAREQRGMPPLSWSNDLASYSQNYSGRISFDTTKHSGRQDVGENIYATTGGRSNGICAAAVGSWMNEEKDYGKNNAAVVGHFTQVIWKTSKELGCGTANGVVTCQYSPPGNWAGRSPYDG